MKHGEGFNLMQYHCKQCGRMETLWNSRDGVTPFGLNCRVCGGKSYHENWSRDVHDPDFGKQLKLGMFPTMRVFVDMKREKLQGYIVERLIRAEGSQYEPPPRGSKEREDLIERIIEGEWHNGTAPDIISAAEYVKAETEDG